MTSFNYRNNSITKEIKDINELSFQMRNPTLGVDETVGNSSPLFLPHTKIHGKGRT